MFFILRGSHTCGFFKGTVEYGFAVESGFIENAQNGLILLFRIDEQTLGFTNSVCVDKIIKILFHGGIDQLGQSAMWNACLVGAITLNQGS